MNQGVMRNPTIDILKGVGILLMIIGHTNIGDDPKVWIYGFHMPLFFILSGYVFNMEKWRLQGLIPFLKSRTYSLLVPYLFFFMVNLAIKIFVDFVKQSGESIPSYLLAGIYSHDTLMPNCAPIWFLTALFSSNLLLWPLVIIKSKLSKWALAGIYILFLWGVCYVLSKYNISQLPWHIDVALIGSVYMLIGYEFKMKVSKVKLGVRHYFVISCLFLAIGSILIMWNGRINMVQNHYQNILIFLFGATCMFVGLYTLFAWFCMKCKKNILFDSLCFLGKHTLTFIGFNYMINSFVRIITDTWGVSETVYNIIDIVIVVTVSVILAFGYLHLRLKIRTIF